MNGAWKSLIVTYPLGIFEVIIRTYDMGSYSHEFTTLKLSKC